MFLIIFCSYSARFINGNISSKLGDTIEPSGNLRADNFGKNAYSCSVKTSVNTGPSVSNVFLIPWLNSDGLDMLIVGISNADAIFANFGIPTPLSIPELSYDHQRNCVASDE